MIQSHLTLGLTAQLEQQVLKEWSLLITESQKTILQEYRLLAKPNCLRCTRGHNNHSKI